MNRRITLASAAALAAVSLGFAGGGPPYLKWSEAIRKAAVTGQPIMVVSMVDQKGEGAGG